MKKGFTLAEVLITIGIIGVVSALTLPTLIQDTQNKELEVRLKTTFNQMNQISQRFYADNGISFTEWASDRGNVLDYAAEFMKYYKGNLKASDYTYQDDISTAPYPMFLLGGQKSDSVLCDDGGFNSEVGGRLFFFNNTPPAGVNGPIICVDINGYQRPNTFGRDILYFNLRQIIWLSLWGRGTGQIFSRRMKVLTTTSSFSMKEKHTAPELQQSLC